MLDEEAKAEIRREVQKQLANAQYGQLAKSDITSDSHDFQVAPANIYPGKGWVYQGALMLGANVVIVWVKLRTQVTSDSEQFIMPNTKQVPRG